MVRYGEGRAFVRLSTNEGSGRGEDTKEKQKHQGCVMEARDAARPWIDQAEKSRRKRRSRKEKDEKDRARRRDAAEKESYYFLWPVKLGLAGPWFLPSASEWSQRMDSGALSWVASSGGIGARLAARCPPAARRCPQPHARPATAGRPPHHVPGRQRAPSLRAPQTN